MLPLPLLDVALAPPAGSEKVDREAPVVLDASSFIN
jgi:hypothetical protein